MKFTCDKCGRAYQADDKVSGRAFRMKCRICGHIIVVKSASAPTPPPGTIPAITPAPFFLDAAEPGHEEEVVIAVSLAPEPAAPSASLPLPPPLPRPGGAPPTLTPVATRMDPPVLTPVATRLPPPVPVPATPTAAPISVAADPAATPVPAPPLRPQPPLREIELDEPAKDEADPFATMAAELEKELKDVPEAPPILPPDPFLQPSGAPSSAPAPVAPKLSEAEEVFADLHRQMDATSGARPLLVNSGTVESKKISRPVAVQEMVRTPPPRLEKRRSLAPIIGLGFGLGAAIAVVWLLASSGPVKNLAEPRAASAPAVAAPTAQGPAPRAEPRSAAPATPPPAPAPLAASPPAQARAADEVAVPPPPEPVVAAPAPAPAPAPQERQAPRQTRASPPPRKAPEPAPSPPPRPAVALAAPPARAPAVQPAPVPAPAPAAPAARPQAEVRPTSPAVVAAAPVSGGGGDRPLEDRDIEATIGRTSPAFEACVAQARKAEPQLVSEERRVTVIVTVNPSGKALYPTLDDQELSSTQLGGCLKREASRMGFPAFAGDPVRVRVPLVLR